MDTARDVLFTAGPQWGERSPDDIMAALDAAGFEIVRKRSPNPYIRGPGDYQPHLMINRRYARAQQLLGEVMHVIGKYICDHIGTNLYRRCAEELLSLFHTKGVHIITDDERAAAGLPPRDEHGLTEDELNILENRFLEALRSPPPFIVNPIPPLRSPK